MDLFNNQVGIDNGRESAQESDFVVASKCFNALTSNKLRVIK